MSEQERKVMRVVGGTAERRRSKEGKGKEKKRKEGRDGRKDKHEGGM